MNTELERLVNSWTGRSIVREPYYILEQLRCAMRTMADALEEQQQMPNTVCRLRFLARRLDVDDPAQQADDLHEIVDSLNKRRRQLH